MPGFELCQLLVVSIFPPPSHLGLGRFHGWDEIPALRKKNRPADPFREGQAGTFRVAAVLPGHFRCHKKEYVHNGTFSFSNPAAYFSVLLTLLSPLLLLRMSAKPLRI